MFLKGMGPVGGIRIKWPIFEKWKMTTKVLKVLKASTWPFPTRTYMEVGTLAKFEISMKVAKKKKSFSTSSIKSPIFTKFKC